MADASTSSSSEDAALMRSPSDSESVSRSTSDSSNSESDSEDEVRPARIDDVVSAAELAARIAQSAAHFDALVDRIPARHYQPQDFTEEDYNKKFFKGTGAKDRKKNQDKEVHHAAMRAKLDPAALKTTREVQLERRLEQLEQQRLAAQKRNTASNGDASSGSSEEGSDSDSDSGVSAPKAMNKGAARRRLRRELEEESKAVRTKGTLVLSTQGDQEAREQLKQRLRQAINDMRTKRGAPVLGAGGSDSSASSSAAAAPAANGGASGSRAQKRAEQKRDKKAAAVATKKRKAGDDAPVANGGSGGDADAAAAAPVIAKPTQMNGHGDDTASGEAPRKRAKKESSSGAAVTLTKLDFGLDRKEKAEALRADDGRPRRDSKKKTTQKLLEEAEQQKLLLRQLQGTQQGVELARTHQWDAALQRAEGKVVRDDPTLLRKTLKREQSIKAKKAKKWADREQQQKDDQQERQRRREQNIQERANDKKKRRSDKKAGIKKPKFKPAKKSSHKPKH